MISINSTSESIRTALYRQQKDDADRIVNEMSEHFWPMIGTANQMAFQAIDDAVEMMKEAGMLREMEKVHALKAIVEYHRYEFAAYQHFNDGRYALWQDLIGRAAEKMEPDVVKLYCSIKTVIDRHGVRQSDVLAQIQTGLALVTLATMMFDGLVNLYQPRTMINVTDRFKAYRLTSVERHWREVGEITGRRVMQDVNLRDDPTCQLGVRVILERFTSADILNEAAGEALRLNPEVLKYVTDEERERYNLNNG